MTNEKTVKEPLFHVVKRDGLSKGKVVLTYVISVAIALLLTSIFCTVSSDKHKTPFDMFGSIFIGAFGTERRIWLFLRDTALLLAVSLAIVPAFKMKFWNLGANGQILVGCWACYACMHYGEGKVPQALLIVLMVVSSVAMGIIWAVIPAIFKAFFKTNESLFTLMMNYLAEGLVTVFIAIWAPTGSGSLSPIETCTLPNIVNEHLLTVIVVALLTVSMFFYLKKSKHGFELSIVGESENTAKYVGINVKKVVIRTLILSGAICGLVGLLLVGSINHTVSTTMANNMGFTAIMTAWLAKMDPLVMIGTCAFITFVSQGMGQVRKDFGFFNDALANVVLGIVYFFIIGCEFFISYRVIFGTKVKEFFGKFKKKQKEDK